MTGLDLTWAGTGDNRTDVFGLSGAVVPELASLSVLALGGLGLLARRRARAAQ